MKKFSGNVLFLDRSDINTDEIIPARYLTENDKSALKPYLMEDLDLGGFSPEKDIAGKRVIITRGNFGCGSSREHAPWALEANGIHLVIGESFARIFRQNMFNCGMMAIELPSETIDHVMSKFTRKDTHLETDLEKNKFILTAGDVREEILFSISAFDRELVGSGGWVDYADGKY